MKTIEPFVNLGWYTVPLLGELKRDVTGKKTLPSFSKDWNNVYLNKRNDVSTPLGGTLTGVCSGIIAIDCDDTATYKMFKALDPDYKFHFVSTGKKNPLGEDIEAGTIIYKYTPELCDGYKIHTSSLQLDFYSNGGFVYLPTEANSTKAHFELCELKEAPLTVKNLLISLVPVKATVGEAALTDRVWKHNLHHQVQNFVNSKKLSPGLFKIITPKDFRDLPAFAAKRYLSPSEVPDGRGSEYLSKISSILGADCSIDEGLYLEAIHLVNELFDQPMKANRLQSTIIEPMVEGGASIDGKIIWDYDENWQDDKLQVLTKRGTVLDCFYDDERMQYAAVNVESEKTYTFGKDVELVSHLDAISVEAIPKKEFKSRLPLIQTVSTPTKKFGFHSDHESLIFNSFSLSVPLSIFREPEAYKLKYKKPTLTLEYLKTLVPDTFMRNYLIGFMRRKFDLFEYSPTVLYFLGVPGAGKDLFVSILELFIGPSGVARPSTKEFLDVYNGWLLDKYIVQLDEYGNQLVKFDDKENALGKIKAYTGKSEFQVRLMRTDGYNSAHSATFVATANKNPLFIEGDDRRMSLFDCPNKLEDQAWVREAGGMSQVHDTIISEINDFAYYLSTEINNLPKDSFMSPPCTHDKKALIASKLSAGPKLAYFFSNQMFIEVESLAKMHDVEHVLEGWGEGRVYSNNLFDLYYEMTEGQGVPRGLAIAMNAFSKVPTTYKQAKSYYYAIPNLRYHIQEGNEFEATDEV